MIPPWLGKMVFRGLFYKTFTAVIITVAIHFHPNLKFEGKAGSLPVVRISVKSSTLVSLSHPTVPHFTLSEVRIINISAQNSTFFNQGWNYPSLSCPSSFKIILYNLPWLNHCVSRCYEKTLVARIKSNLLLNIQMYNMSS